MKQTNNFSKKRLTPLPEKAKKVFEGVQFSVWQWEQKMYDGSRETFEMLKRADSVGVIASDSRKRIIVLEEEQPGRSFITIPGGRIDHPSIPPKKEALRELESETGYSSHRLRHWRTASFSSKIDWQVYLFCAKNCFVNGRQNLDPGEKIKVKWVSFNEFLKLGFNEKFRDIELVPDLVKAYYSKAYRQKLYREFFN